MKKILLTFLMFFPLIQGFSQVWYTKHDTVYVMALPIIEEYGWMQVSEAMTSEDRIDYGGWNRDMIALEYTIDFDNMIFERKWKLSSGKDTIATHEIDMVTQLDKENEMLEFWFDWDDRVSSFFITDYTNSEGRGFGLFFYPDEDYESSVFTFKDRPKWVHGKHLLGFTGRVVELEIVD